MEGRYSFLVPFRLMERPRAGKTMSSAGAPVFRRADVLRREVEDEKENERKAVDPIYKEKSNRWA